MAKGKSSASSATRKKHAKKAAAALGQLDEPQAPKEKKAKDKKGSKRSKEPRKKVYIPPTKPVPVQPDPLDTLGIAQQIPAELHVVLRRLAKKDSVTKRRALEEFHADWVEKGSKAEGILDALEAVLPVWVCSVSPFRMPCRTFDRACTAAPRPFALSTSIKARETTLRKPPLRAARLPFVGEGSSVPPS